MRNQYPRIDGGSGKVIRCHPEAQSSYDVLQALVRKGSHWARTLTDTIKSISLGHSVHPGFAVIKKSTSNLLIDISTPGANLILERYPDDSYVLTKILFPYGCSTWGLSSAYIVELSENARIKSEAASQKSKNKLLMHFERYDGKQGVKGQLHIYKGLKSIYSGVAYNAPMNTGDEPFGTYGQLAVGSYKVTRRLCGECRYKDHPAISNMGAPGNVRTPSGRIRSGIVMHRGFGPHHSQGCIVSPDMYEEQGPINTLMQFEVYRDGGSIPLHITFQDG